ncbi:hypothetical protein DWG18_07035 [Lysobacter sp. TY2-98]|uniref:hypothetical protein n=1 Tax=Lysobacter sp. TY2-98 TaxID=2290922 RepID=UPI000E1FF7B7|nr:hypothetical protein [Lysobacter sp. TY2-98]AXK72060.1 hypothetical protein DWG18_07035 [Lysobacter sp. TY2-98]
MTDGAPAPPTPLAAPARSRRRVWWIALLIAIVLVAGLSRWATRPRQVASLVMSQAGRVLGLRITAKGVSEYTLGNTPRLVLREVTAQRDGDATPLLKADRIAMSVPLSTIRSRGAKVTVHRIEIDHPQLDIGALQRWLATRPPTPTRPTPTLTDGFVARDGVVTGDGWIIDGLAVDVPRLAPRRIVRGTLRGRMVAGETRVPFEVAATLARPEMPAGLGVAGRVTVQRPDWSLPMDLVLRGVPDLTHDIALNAISLSARARYVSPSTTLPFALGIGGRATYAQGLHLAPFGLAFRKGDSIPDLTASGRLDWTSALSLQLDGAIARWPQSWPELPAPLHSPRGPLPMQLAYTGPVDFSGDASLHLESGATRFDGRFRLPRVLAWLDASSKGTPLPPLDGRVSTPRLEFPAVKMDGVEVEFSDGE